MHTKLYAISNTIAFIKMQGIINFAYDGDETVANTRAAERVLADSAFRNSKRFSDLLKFIVDRHLRRKTCSRFVLPTASGLWKT